jgi:hypothetical protein
MLRATGTSNIARIDLVRNNEYVFSDQPNKSAVELKYVDMEPRNGTNLYYFRVLQTNGEIAWCSPVWISREK